MGDKLRGGTTIGGYLALHSGLKDAYISGNFNIGGNLSLTQDKWIDFAGNSTWGGTLRIGGNGHTSSSNASVVSTNENLHLDSASGGEIYLNHYAGNGVNFSNGSSSIVATIDNAGNFWTTGSVDCDGLTVDNGTSSLVTIKCDDGGNAVLDVRGDGQGTGVVYVGQSTGYGGGIFYNGDGTPSYASGESSDYTCLFRRVSNNNYVVMKYPHNSNNVIFTGELTANKLFGTVYNDYAEYRQSKEKIRVGYIATESENGYIIKSDRRLDKNPMVVSDCFGFAIGKQDIKEEYSLPIAVSGRVLVYTDKDRSKFKIGDVVCAGKDGRASKMKWWEKIIFPDRILGIVSEIPKYKEWGTDKIKVDNRIWIKVR